jgi:hypothetical protein
MSSVRVYPGIRKGTLEFYYKCCRVQEKLELSLPEEGVHSIYECGHFQKESGTMRCDFQLTIMEVLKQVNLKINGLNRPPQYQY